MASPAFLPLVDNPRFLILPWIEIPNLGSPSSPSSAAACPKTGPSATTPRRCSSRPSSKRPRYTGAVYRASGWLRVGTTQGRGRYDRDKLYDKPARTSGSGPSEGIGGVPSSEFSTAYLC